MQLYYYEFFPFDRFSFSPVIIESPMAAKPVAVRFFREHGFYEGEYQSPIYHTSLISATARDRGCQFRIGQNQDFFYSEKQGSTGSDQFDIEYCTANKYHNIDHQPKMLDGCKLRKSHIFLQTYVSEVLLKLGYSWVKKICPNGFDGTVCRHCKGPKYMSEPDHLESDGMFSCYTCKERLINYGMWKYK